MMLTWFFAGLCLHQAMTSQPSKVLFVAQDEDRALIPLDYCRTLWEQQDAPFRALWPLARPMAKQAYNRLELSRGGEVVALPGKDPDKIRGEHPTIVAFDEAADMDNFGESFDVALAARPLKIVAFSSAKPGGFRERTKHATTAPWEYAAA